MPIEAAVESQDIVEGSKLGRVVGEVKSEHVHHGESMRVTGAPKFASAKLCR